MPAKTKVDREEFARLYEEGLSLSELAEHFGAHPATLYRVRVSLGLPATVRRMTPERKAAISAMLDDGWSFAEVQRTEGADWETLARHFPGRAWTTAQRMAHVNSSRVLEAAATKAAWAVPAKAGGGRFS